MEPLQISAQELTALTEELIAGGKRVEIPTRGNSMRPMLSFEGSFVRLTAPTALKRGDVALYRYPDGLCALHRIVKIQKDGTLVCRGDGNLWTETVKPEWIIGVMTDFCRNGKWISANAIGYRIYSRVWMALWPLRRIAMPIWKACKGERK